MAKMFYTADEVKTMFGLDDQGLRALVQAGKLPAVHHGPAGGIQAPDQDQLGLADTDALARTTLAPGESGEGALQLDGSGSGSGLLDLTREGDDTSLGAVLDEIYPGEEGTAAGGAGLGTAVAAAMGTGLASALGPAVPEA